MTGRVNKVGAFLRKLQVIIEVAGPKKEAQIFEHFHINIPKTTFFLVLTYLDFFGNFLKNVPI